MALVPIRIDRTSKPPLGTPLRSDGHWSIQGLIGAWLFNEGAGNKSTNPVTAIPSEVVNVDLSKGNATYNGSSSYIKTPYNAKFTVKKGVTLLTKIKRDTMAEGDGLFTNRGTSGGQTFSVNSSGYLTYTLNSVADYVSALSVPIGKFVDICISTNSTSANFYVNGATNSKAIGTPLASTNDIYFGVGLNSSGAISGYSDYESEYLFYYGLTLTPDEIKSITANPYQIFEPETIWIEIPDDAGGGTTYSDTLAAMAESYASVTDVATYVDAATALITAGVDAASAVAMAEAVLTTAQAADTVSDMVQRVESLISVVQAADTVADAQAITESLLAEITATATVADSLNSASAESLTTEIAAASTVQDVVTMLEQVYTTLEAVATVTDEQTSGVAENLLTSATAITSVSDLQLMVDNVTVMAQSGASIGEIGSYLEQIATAATAEASVTDTIVGAFTYYSDYICRLPSEQRICRLPSEQRICRLPSEQRIIAIPSERRICRLTRSSL